MTRNSKIFVERFIPFLTERQLFDRYVSNYSACFSRLPLNHFADTTVVDCWIACAFDFYKAPEGFDFWYRISEDWQAIARHY